MSITTAFYTGDRDRIVDAFKRDDVHALVKGGIVVAEADFPFNVWPENLDCLVRGACTLLKRPAMTFAESIQLDFIVSSCPDPPFGISEMSDAFAELFASIPLSQVDELYDMWFTEMEKTAPVSNVPPETGMQRLIRNLVATIEYIVFAAVSFPVLAAYWLVSPRFRRDRRKNRAKANAPEGTSECGVEYTKNGLAALITTCKTARDQHRTVLYAWAL